jgi:urea carboxylase-associated protein 1
MTKTSPLLPGEAVFRYVIKAGDYWIDTIRQGQRLRIVDLEGNQAADTLFFNADDVADRYSAVDTIREQRNVYLSCGSKLLSTSGAVLAEIVADTVGRHDTLGGACATESNTVRYDLEKRTMHACRDSYLLALAHHDALGMGKRDLSGGRRPHLRRRLERPRSVCRTGRGHEHHRAHLQLSAAQQSLQRL